MSSSCASLSPTITKAPIITYSPVNNPETIKRATLIEKIQRKRHQYFKRIKKHSSPKSDKRVIDGESNRTNKNITAPNPCNFDMDSERFASHIIEKAKTKMKQNSKRRVFSLPVTSKTLSTSSPIHDYKNNRSHMKRRLMPPLSPVEHALTPQKSLEYSKRYKEVQRKWYEGIQEHKHSTPVPVLSPLLKSCKYVKASATTNNNQSINSSITGTDGYCLDGNPTRCKRQLTFTENGNKPQTKKLYSPANKEAAVISTGSSSGHLSTASYSSGIRRMNRSLSCTQPLTKVPTANHTKLMMPKTKEFSSLMLPAFRQRRNTFIKDYQEKECILLSKQELEYSRQQKMSLKLLQRTQIYALNEVMKELEEANFVQEMNKNQETNKNQEKGA